MNTRQKLTLGIAAIFMVTLTIVGVTYAYFVTKITGTSEDETITVVKSAEIGVAYSDNEGNVVLNDVIPGTSVYKAFAVTNTGDLATKFALTLKTTATVGKEFVHTDLDTTNTEENTNEIYDICYVSTASSTTTDCFKTGVEYNNIYVSLAQVSAANAGTTSEFFRKDQTALASLYTGGNEVQVPINAPHTGVTINLDSKLQDIAIDDDKTENVDEAVNYYILKVDYRSVNANQNIENLAEIKVIPSISDTMLSVQGS